MSFQDKSLTCADCSGTFVFSAQEQEFFQSKGYINEPKRCPTCRQARRGDRPQRQTFPAICAACGKETQVPFEPRGDRPVYCSDCYRKIKPAQ